MKFKDMPNHHGYEARKRDMLWSGGGNILALGLVTLVATGILLWRDKNQRSKNKQ